MSISALQGQPALQYLQRPAAGGQPQQVQPQAGGNDHDGDEVGGVDVGTDNDRGSNVDLRA